MMKKIILNSLVVGLITGMINALLAFTLGGSVLETPYAGPDATEPIPPPQFAIGSLIITVVLTLIGGLILALLTRKNVQRGVRIWVIIGVIFLIVYGIFPFAGPVASFKAGILTNLQHAVAGFGALYFIPRRAGLMHAA